MKLLLAFFTLGAAAMNLPENPQPTQDFIEIRCPPYQMRNKYQKKTPKKDQNLKQIFSIEEQEKEVDDNISYQLIFFSLGRDPKEDQYSIRVHSKKDSKDSTDIFGNKNLFIDDILETEPIYCQTHDDDIYFLHKVARIREFCQEIEIPEKEMKYDQNQKLPQFMFNEEKNSFEGDFLTLHFIIDNEIEKNRNVKGHYGQVVFLTLGGKDVVVKRIPWNKFSLSEVRYLEKFSGKGITADYYGCFKVGDNIYIILEKLECIVPSDYDAFTLKDTENSKRLLVFILLSRLLLKFHKITGLIHGDIKPKNIGYCEKTQSFKFFDLGFSAPFGQFTGFRGTYGYMIHQKEMSGPPKAFIDYFALASTFMSLESAANGKEIFDHLPANKPSLKDMWKKKYDVEKFYGDYSDIMKVAFKKNCWGLQLFEMPGFENKVSFIEWMNQLIGPNIVNMESEGFSKMVDVLEKFYLSKNQDFESKKNKPASFQIRKVNPQNYQTIDLKLV